MKKILLFLCLFSFPVTAAERTTNGLTEAQQLGITAGTALACNAGSKLDDFALIASRIIANQALTSEAEQQGYREFAESKLRAYNEQRRNPQESCGGVLDSFNHLPIFRSVVYADGGLKMYDGKYLKPLRPIKKASSKKKTSKKK